MAAAFERSVLRIDHPEAQQGMTPQHRVRPLLAEGMRGDWASIDPFLALMEDWFSRGVFGKHPHRGIETVTYVLEGRIDHYDSQGNQGVIEAGDAQWMTAGRGLIHNEIPAEGQVVHSLQLWVCAVKGGAFQWVQGPPGETLQPEATGAVMEVTKWLKPSV